MLTEGAGLSGMGLPGSWTMSAAGASKKLGATWNMFPCIYLNPSPAENEKLEDCTQVNACHYGHLRVAVFGKRSSH